MRAASLSEHALTATHNAMNSDELDVEELVDKVKGEQDKVVGEVVHQQDPHMLPYSIVMR